MIAIYLRLQIDSNQRRVSFDARVTCILYRLYLEVISQFKTENPQRSSLFLSPMRLVTVSTDVLLSSHIYSKF